MLLAQIVDKVPAKIQKFSLRNQIGSRKVEVKLQDGMIVVQNRATGQVICALNTTKDKLMWIECFDV